MGVRTKFGSGVVMGSQDVMNMSEWKLYPRLFNSTWKNKLARKVGIEFFTFSDQMDWLEEAWENW